MRSRGSGSRKNRKMNRLMKQYGLNMEAIEDVEEVIIRLSDRELRFRQPGLEVTIMDVQGMRSYQITGTPEELTRRGERLEIPRDDIELVMAQTGVDEGMAKKALISCDGNPAEAIMKLLEEQ